MATTKSRSSAKTRAFPPPGVSPAGRCLLEPRCGPRARRALAGTRSGTSGSAPRTRFAAHHRCEPDAVREDVALAVQGGRLRPSPTEEVLADYPGAEQYDGRHQSGPGPRQHPRPHAAVARGFNEDRFPEHREPRAVPASLLEGEEGNLMVQVAALEAIRTGTTTIVEYTGNVQRQAAVLADSGLRCVFAEGIRDAENVPGPMSTRAMAQGVSDPPRFSERLRDEGMERISDLFSTWHGERNGRISVFPAAALAETSSPELLREVREFAETHDLGYTIHLNQSRAEYEYMVMHHGLRPAAYLDRHGFLGPRLFAAHARYVNHEEVALLGRSGTIIAHQAGMASNRGISPPIPELRAAGCPIALGTDNNTNDVFEVMRIAMLTERIRRNRDGDEVPGLSPQPEDVLADATQGGAQAVNQADDLGTLEIRKKADLLVVNTLRAHLVPAGRFISALVHSGHPGDIESVMVDGGFVMRDRTVLTMDEENLLREADAVGRRIWSQVLDASPLNVPRLPRPG